MRRFGPHLKQNWVLDPEVTYLNHGTVGATPRSILDRQTEIRDAIERQPARFLFRELYETNPAQTDGVVPHLRAVAERVGGFLGARGHDIVFVDNATVAINAVLKSFDYEPGGTLALTSYGYGSFPPLAEHVAKRNGLRFETIELPFPVSDPAEILDAFADGLPDRTRLVVVDHIASATGVLLPINEIAKLCRDRDVVLVVDGAHVPGNIDVNIAEIGADVYVGNLHKWMWTPRSSAILWVREQLQRQIRPLIVSWGHGQGFLSEFDQMGTVDPSAHLSASAAIDLLAETGFAGIVEHNHRLAVQAAETLAAAWDSQVLSAPDCMTTMAAVSLPDRLGVDPRSAVRFRDRLLDEYRVEVSIGATDRWSWARVGIQIYNDINDVQRLAEAVTSIANQS